MNVLGVIPARGGSKGIPRKNLRLLNGISLVGHAARTAQETAEITKTVVSSDCPLIIKEAIKFGVEAPFIRPDELSGDIVGDQPVLEHALVESEKYYGCIFDYIVMIQPTAPLRTVEHLKQAISYCIENQYESVWTVSRLNPSYHPDKVLCLENGLLNYYSQSGRNVVARQQLSALYYRNGLAYVVSRSLLLDDKSLIGKNTGALFTSGNFVSIDVEADLNLTEQLMNKDSL